MPCDSSLLGAFPARLVDLPPDQVNVPPKCGHVCLHGNVENSLENEVCRIENQSSHIFFLPLTQVQPQDVVMGNFLDSLATHGKTVSAQEYNQFSEFTNKFGEKG